MGVVVRARDVTLDRTVAIKVPHARRASRAETVERLLREARAAAMLQSDHVCRVLEVGRSKDGGPFIVLEYLEGVSLGRYLRTKQRLPIDDVFRFMLEICDAVGEAHGLGIVHRDLKPQNFFLVESSNGRRKVKVFDFGISKLEDAEDPRLTTSDVLMGSPSYIAPEQMVRTRDVDARADVWALGVSMYELLTGTLPFVGSSVMDLAVRIAADDPAPPRALRSEVPEALEQVVLRCLAKDPAQRFASAVELRDALLSCAPPQIAQAYATMARSVALSSVRRLQAETLPPIAHDADTVTDPIAASARSESRVDTADGTGVVPLQRTVADAPVARAAALVRDPPASLPAEPPPRRRGPTTIAIGFAVLVVAGVAIFGARTWLRPAASTVALPVASSAATPIEPPSALATALTASSPPSSAVAPPPPSSTASSRPTVRPRVHRPPPNDRLPDVR